MSNLMKFMMAIITLAFLMFLNSKDFQEKYFRLKEKAAILPNRKITA